MSDKSTPTPWHLETSDGLHRIIGAGNIVAFHCVYGRGRGHQKLINECSANAALIVRAVNHHEELIAFLKPLADHADYLEQHFQLDKHPDAVNPGTHLAMPGLTLADCQRIRAVLQKLKDQSHG